MSETASSDLDRRLRAYQGRAAGGGTGKDPVNAPMIRHWCEVIGDRNPVCAGKEPLAPPAMLQVWTMAGLSGGPGGTGAYAELTALLAESGCTAVVATDCEQEYLRPLRPGEVITFESVIESVSPRKRTRLGAGHFVTTVMEIRADGVPAGRHRFRVLRYTPGAPPAKPAAPRPERPRPVVNRDNAGFWDGVAERRLLIQRCTDCERLRFPWLPGCAGCGSPRWTTVDSAGTGTVHSFVVMHHPPFPAFDPPYAVGLIELAEGVRMISNVVGVEPGRITVGMPVRLEFLDAGEGQLLPVFRAVEPGRRLLPPLVVPVTRTLIIAGALACRDYQDVHHDPEAARAKGAPDIFMNILTTYGLVGRYVAENFGPGAVIERMAIRLGVPNYPGDVLTLTGSVADRGELSEVAVTGVNALGRHVMGTVTLREAGR
ncbi:OB-fold domain-containing protein [Streptomyces sp. NPDC052396]|uniref:OB-fold domain-containing protein n=1 Tax=Streptomyces sp. NPDC052396 TaxID=3365689 RepID=UPI0037D19F33